MADLYNENQPIDLITLSQLLREKNRLEKAGGTDYLASLVDAGGRGVACGLGVLEGEAVGLFDLITDPAERKKGYGTRLLAGILRWSRENGACHAYLQVMEVNVVARKLYAKFGFQEVYRYWYRVPTPE